MKFEICKRKTKCQECEENMRKGDIRGVYGEGYFSDPIRYYCMKCLRDRDINIESLKKVYKEKVKYYTKKLEELEKLRKQVKKVTK